MKKLNFLLIIFVFFLSSCTKDPLRIDIPKHKKTVLKNGLHVYFFEDHKLPTINFYFVTKIGATHEPLHLKGLASLTTSLLLEGTKTKTSTELAEALELIEECGCEYTPLKTPYRRFNPDELALVSDPEIEIFSAGNYIPFNRRNPNEPVNTFSSEIITLKRAKEYTYEELTQHRRDQPEFTDDYFAGGLVRTGKSFSDVFRRMFERLLPIFEGANTNEMHLIIPAPNSNPEECYASDVNYIFTNAISRYFEDMYSFDKRFLVRADPVRKSGRSTDEHIRTIGTTDGIQYRDFRHAVIFDDVTTSGSQIAAIGKVLRASGYEGNLSGVVLGKTV